MKLTSMVLAVAYLAVGSGVASACGSDRPVLSTENHDGTKIGLFISGSQI